jgi:hypothetical protein
LRALTSEGISRTAGFFFSGAVSGFSAESTYAPGRRSPRFHVPAHSLDVLRLSEWKAHAILTGTVGRPVSVKVRVSNVLPRFIIVGLLVAPAFSAVVPPSRSSHIWKGRRGRKREFVTEESALER